MQTMQIITKILLTIPFFLISCGPSGAEMVMEEKYKSDSLFVDSISKLNQIQCDSISKLDSSKINCIEIELSSTQNNEKTLTQTQSEDMDSLYAAQKEAYKILKLKKREYKMKTLKNSVNSIDIKLDSISYYLKENKVKNEKQRENNHK